MAGRRWWAIGGVVGPAAFVTAWAVLGTGRDGYSPVHDPISRLAAVDAPSRSTMTAGFLVFGLGVAAFAPALARALDGRAALAATTTAAATVAVAALPLGGRGGDLPHAGAAFVAYAALAATPHLGGRALARQGRRGLATASTVTAVIVAALLAISAVAPRFVGLTQRLGLTLGDAWIVTAAVAMLLARSHVPADLHAGLRRR